MRRIMSMCALAALLVFAVTPTALAINGSGGAGRDYGQHHAEHAITMGGFTGTENPGVMHQGFSGWTGS